MSHRHHQQSSSSCCCCTHQTPHQRHTHQPHHRPPTRPCPHRHPPLQTHQAKPHRHRHHQNHPHLHRLHHHQHRSLGSRRHRERYIPDSFRQARSPSPSPRPSPNPSPSPNPRPSPRPSPSPGATYPSSSRIYSPTPSPTSPSSKQHLHLRSAIVYPRGTGRGPRPSHQGPRPGPSHGPSISTSPSPSPSPIPSAIPGPKQVRALFFLATVCDEGRSFADTKSARMRLVDWDSGAEICRYVPATKARHALGARMCAPPGTCTASSSTPCVPTTAGRTHGALRRARRTRHEWHRLAPFHHRRGRPHGA